MLMLASKETPLDLKRLSAKALSLLAWSLFDGVNAIVHKGRFEWWSEWMHPARRCVGGSASWAAWLHTVLAAWHCTQRTSQLKVG